MKAKETPMISSKLATTTIRIMGVVDDPLLSGGGLVDTVFTAAIIAFSCVVTVSAMRNSDASNAITSVLIKLN
jgi:hypothetical protein